MTETLNNTGQESLEPSKNITDKELAEITGISLEEAEQMSIGAQFYALVLHQYCNWPAGAEGDENYMCSIRETKKIVTEENETGRSILDKNKNLILVDNGESVSLKVDGRPLSILYRPFRGFRPLDNTTLNATPEEHSKLCALDAEKQDKEQKRLPFGLKESIRGLEGVTTERATRFLQELTGISEVGKLDLDIMVNPFMIFDYHITAAAREHQPQKSINIMFHLLNMSRQLEMNGIFNPKDFNASMKNHAHGQLMPKKLPIFESLEDIWTDKRQLFEVIDLEHIHDDVRVFVPNEGELHSTPVVVSGKNIFQVLEAYAKVQKRLYGNEDEKASVVYEYNEKTSEYTIAMIPRNKPHPDNFEVTIEFEENGELVTEKHVVMCRFASAEEGGEIVANKRNDIDDPEHDLKLLLDPLRGPKIIEAIYKAVNEERASFMQRLKIPSKTA